MKEIWPLQREQLCKPLVAKCAEQVKGFGPACNSLSSSSSSSIRFMNWLMSSWLLTPWRESSHFSLWGIVRDTIFWVPTWNHDVRTWVSQHALPSSKRIWIKRKKGEGCTNRENQLCVTFRFFMEDFLFLLSCAINLNLDCKERIFYQQPSKDQEYKHNTD